MSRPLVPIDAIADKVSRESFGSFWRYSGQGSDFLAGAGQVLGKGFKALSSGFKKGKGGSSKPDKKKSEKESGKPTSRAGKRGQERPTSAGGDDFDALDALAEETSASRDETDDLDALASDIASSSDGDDLDKLASEVSAESMGSFERFGDAIADRVAHQMFGRRSTASR